LLQTENTGIFSCRYKNILFYPAWRWPTEVESCRVMYSQLKLSKYCYILYS